MYVWLGSSEAGNSTTFLGHLPIIVCEWVCLNSVWGESIEWGWSPSITQMHTSIIQTCWGTMQWPCIGSPPPPPPVFIGLAHKVAAAPSCLPHQLVPHCSSLFCRLLPEHDAWHHADTFIPHSSVFKAVHAHPHAYLPHVDVITVCVCTCVLQALLVFTYFTRLLLQQQLQVVYRGDGRISHQVNKGWREWITLESHKDRERMSDVLLPTS